MTSFVILLELNLPTYEASRPSRYFHVVIHNAYFHQISMCSNVHTCQFRSVTEVSENQLQNLSWLRLMECKIMIMSCNSVFICPSVSPGVSQLCSLSAFIQEHSFTLHRILKCYVKLKQSICVYICIDAKMFGHSPVMKAFYSTGYSKLLWILFIC